VTTFECRTPRAAQAGVTLGVYSVRDHDVMLTFEQPAVEQTQGAPDIWLRFPVLEQIRKHRRGFVPFIGFAFFGKPSERCVGRCVCQ